MRVFQDPLLQGHWCVALGTAPVWVTGKVAKHGLIAASLTQSCIGEAADLHQNASLQRVVAVAMEPKETMGKGRVTALALFGFNAVAALGTGVVPAGRFVGGLAAAYEQADDSLKVSCCYFPLRNAASYGYGRFGSVAARQTTRFAFLVVMSASHHIVVAGCMQHSDTCVQGRTTSLSFNKVSPDHAATLLRAERAAQHNITTESEKPSEMPNNTSCIEAATICCRRLITYILTNMAPDPLSIVDNELLTAAAPYISLLLHADRACPDGVLSETAHAGSNKVNISRWTPQQRLASHAGLPDSPCSRSTAAFQRLTRLARIAAVFSPADRAHGRTQHTSSDCSVAAW